MVGITFNINIVSITVLYNVILMLFYTPKILVGSIKLYWTRYYCTGFLP